MKVIHILSAILLIHSLSCGKKNSEHISVDTSPIQNEALNSATDEIRSQLRYCEGVPIYWPGKNGVTGREDCDNGDALLYAGLLYSVTKSESLADGIKRSIDTEGRVYRSPEHLKGADNINAASRDMWLGFLEYCLTSKDKETCERAYNRAREHDWRICDKDDDERCLLTPSVVFVTGYVWAANGWHTYGEMEPSDFEIKKDEDATIASAKSVTVSYRLHLISLRLWLMIQTGNLTQRFKETVKIITNREPSNLWYQYLSAVAFQTSKEQIAPALLELMSQWHRNSERSHWLWATMEAPNRAMGHELVFLACALLGGCNGQD